MLKAYKITRIIVITLLVIITAVPVGLYITLNTQWAHQKMCRVARTELGKLLGTRVEIDRLDFAPFNRIRLTGVGIADDNDSLAVTVHDIAARFELDWFLRTGQITVDYVALDSLDAHIYRATPDSPLNISRIIKKLSKKEPGKPPTRFNLSVSTVIISASGLSYDVLSAPRRGNGVFDPSHIVVSGLSVGASLPRLSNDTVRVDLDRLTFAERSGLELRSLRARVAYTPKWLTLSDLEVELPHTRISLAPVRLDYNSPAAIANTLRTAPLTVTTVGENYVTPSDLSAFLPALGGITDRFYLTLDAVGNRHAVSLRQLSVVNKRSGLRLSASGEVANPADRSSLRVDKGRITFSSQPGALDFVNAFAGDRQARLANLLRRAGAIRADITADGALDGFSVVADIASGAGSIKADIEGANNGKTWTLDGQAVAADLQAGLLADNPRLGSVSAEATFDGTFAPGNIAGQVNAAVRHFVLNGNTFRNLQLDGYADPQKNFGGTVVLDDDSTGYADLQFEGSYNHASPRFKASGKVRGLALAKFGVKGKYASYRLTTDLDADLSGHTGDWINGYAHIDNLTYEGNGPTLTVRHFSAEANNTTFPNRLTIESDFLNGSMEGRIYPSAIPAQARNLLASAMPVLGTAPDNSGKSHSSSHSGSGSGADSEGSYDNDFTFDFTIANAENLSAFLGLPAGIIYPVTIDGIFNNGAGVAGISIDAPYLQQNDKIIENTSLNANIMRKDGRAEVYATTVYPTQKGVMAISTGMTASANRIDTKIGWQIERDKPIDGNLSFSTLVETNGAGGYTADIAVNPGTINFGQAVWSLHPAHILAGPGLISVDHFAMTTPGQAIRVNGSASTGSNSELLLNLSEVELIDIFRTLDINNALIGGRATGVFHARELFSATPALWCDNLHVRDISYNDCVMGDAEVRAAYKPDDKAFSLDADITGRDGNLSRISGDIVTTGSLDLTFDARHIPVGFMKPFMSAFADDLSGYASGRARLFGTFHDINLEGNVRADSLGLKLGFTNTWYYATDSVHIRPGIINLDNIRLSDRYGHTAMLNGFVRHQCFHKPEFEFRVTNADRLLVYDVPSRLSPDWYGRIFGNGSAYVSGKPGLVNIDVNMSTTENSTFTFVLSDDEEADEYNFITFRDKTPHVVRDSLVEIDRLPAAVAEYRRRMREKAAQADEPSEYRMNIQVDITPAAKVILVMDPVGGDEIKATGNGNLRMTYNSTGNELHMYGTYVIDHGSYNFTLQDIIVKDFTIREGSSITFTGDPYAAQLDIKALYNVNANLSDLDESFLQDKDLNRTNVPVSAVLMARGDMRQPDISFDLDFPTLNSDVYRKVRSIVSTDEMMNRQIIYLLALNRFYTPEYMSTTKGNELFSVASSTIASQLSSMLGKLSENWSIAPNLRSDRGDFSDVEVDVALSSSLLNNRLLFNGNFGYRDKSLNTNQFVGDFDIEYLLNRRGNWRLKAYNRYNDQNYYLRTAQTTQGVGIMYKRDFDTMFGFLRNLRKPKEDADTVKTDTVPSHKVPSKAALSDTVPSDSRAQSVPADSLKKP